MPIDSAQELSLARHFRAERWIGGMSIGLFAVSGAVFALSFAQRYYTLLSISEALVTPLSFGLLLSNALSFHLFRRAGGRRSPLLFIASTLVDVASGAIICGAFFAGGYSAQGITVCFGLPSLMLGNVLAIVDYGVDTAESVKLQRSFQVGLAPMIEPHREGVALVGRF